MEMEGIRGKIMAIFFVVCVIVSIATGQTTYLEAANGPYASDPFPPDGATDVPVDQVLSWMRGDDTAQDEVYFGTDPAPPLVATIPITSPAEWDPPGDLIASTTYYWQIVEVNGLDTYPGPVWSFSTISGKAFSPKPADGAAVPGAVAGGNIYTTLDFSAGLTTIVVNANYQTGYFSDDYSKVAGRDQDANLGPLPHPPATRYYAGLSEVPPYTQSLVRGTTYYWCVDGTDDKGNTFPGDIWEFAIRDYYAFEPTPPDEAIFVSPDVLLTWREGLGSGILEHDVYIGTSWNDVNDATTATPDIYKGSVLTPNYQCSGLSDNTRFYWRIDEVWDRLPWPAPSGPVYKGHVWCFKTAGLIAHWKFDEGSGAIAYDSAGTNDGIIYGAQWTNGILETALSFDGIDDYIDVLDNPQLSPTQALTVSAWIWTDSNWLPPGGYPRIVCKHYDCKHYDVGGRGYTLFLTTGPHLKATLNGQGFQTQSQIPLACWAHVALTFDSSDGKAILYIDGQRDPGELSLTNPLSASGCGLRIGDQSCYAGGTGTKVFHGKIDEVRIYNRALSAGEIEELYQSEVPVVETYHVDGATGDNTNDGLTRETAFATIQRGINIAEDYDTVLVWPGVYNEEISFWGDAITVKSAADAAMLETDYGYAFSFFSAEGLDTVLSNFIIRNSQYGIYLVNGSSPTLRNLTIVNNDFGISAFNGSDPDISNCIFWSNYYGDLFRDPVPLQAKYSCIEEGCEGEGNISIEPLFADANNGDYHLLSERGRYWPAHDVWVLDKVTSSCVDGGDPAVDPSDEPMPNGGRINMGAYGGTAYASMSEMQWLDGDINHDNIVNMKDLAILANNWLKRIRPVIIVEDDTEDSYSCEGYFDVSHPCSDAVDEDWDTYALTADAGATSYIYENYTIPPGVVMAEFTIKYEQTAAVTPGYCTNVTDYWDGSTWRELNCTALTNQISTITVEIPDGALSGSTLQLRTQTWKGLGIPGSGDGMYYEGKVIWHLE